MIMVNDGKYNGPKVYICIYIYMMVRMADDDS